MNKSRFSIIVITLICWLSAVAQSISVASFKMLPNDLVSTDGTVIKYTHPVSFGLQ